MEFRGYFSLREAAVDSVTPRYLGVRCCYLHVKDVIAYILHIETSMTSEINK